MEEHTVEGPADCICFDEVKCKQICRGPSDVSLEIIASSRKVGIHVMTVICQSPRSVGNANWMGSKYSVSIFMVMGDARNCSC